MKTNKYLTALLSILLLAATAISLASCNKDDDPKESDINNVNNNDNPDTPSGQNPDSLVRYYNDLEYFLSYFVATDSAGNFLYRSMGVPLYESDSAHLYIGVDNIDEALRYFEFAIAPDIAKQISVSHNYTYTLTDTSGNSQGTVSFVPGGGSSVAEITTDLPDLRFFNKVTFLQNSAWPYNSDDEKGWKFGDVRKFHVSGKEMNELLDPSDVTRDWVLIREKGNGITSLWITITSHSYINKHDLRTYTVFTEAKAKEIAYIYQANRELLSTLLPSHDSKVWLGKTGRYFAGLAEKDYYIDLLTGIMDNEAYLSGYTYYKHPFLYAIEWLDDRRSFLTLMGAHNTYKGEYAYNLFDNDVNTKWRDSNRYPVTSEISGEKCWIVECMSEKPINPTAYYMTTCDDTKQYPKRNPRIWSIYAKKNINDVWVLIDKRDNTDSQIERMADENFWTGWWGVSVGKAQYQYFRLEVYETWGDDYFQISEFGFKYDENTENDDNEVYYSVIDASDGYPGNLAPNLFDGDFDTKWCVDEDNKSGTPLHDGDCWYVEFRASKPITPAGFYMTTANDHTVFPGRAPRKWNIYGLKDGWWTLIASYDNTETSLFQMTYADKWTGYWVINGMKGEYQYFRLEMYENWGADCFQISELGFYF